MLTILVVIACRSPAIISKVSARPSRGARADLLSACELMITGVPETRELDSWRSVLVVLAPDARPTEVRGSALTRSRMI